MTFKIYRASAYGAEAKPPIPEAQRHDYTEPKDDWINVGATYKPHWWSDRGVTNKRHAVERYPGSKAGAPLCDHYSGEVPAHHWTITIDTFEQLMALVQREGALVVAHDEITIYDSYIE